MKATAKQMNHFWQHQRADIWQAAIVVGWLAVLVPGTLTAAGLTNPPDTPSATVTPTNDLNTVTGFLKFHPKLNNELLRFHHAEYAWLASQVSDLRAELESQPSDERQARLDYYRKTRDLIGSRSSGWAAR